MEKGIIKLTKGKGGCVMRHSGWILALAVLVLHVWKPDWLSFEGFGALLPWTETMRGVAGTLLQTF